MRTWDILRARLRSLVFRDRREADLQEELQGHLDREAERLRAEGLAPEAARAQARRTFGGVEQIREECRDARGTAFFENTVRDLFYAMRTFRRAPLVALTIVTTVALGLGLVAVAFTLLNTLVFRVDAVPDVHEMFAVERPRTADDEVRRPTRAEFDALRRETAMFTDAYAQVPDVDSRVDGRVVFGTLVTGNAFQVLGVPAAIGRALTPADDMPGAAQLVMVLSDRGWNRLFARDPTILGRHLIVNGLTFEVVGVMPAGFRGLAVAADDYWAPLGLLGELRPMLRGREATAGVEIIGRLRPDVSPEAAEAGLKVWDTARPERRPLDRGGSNVVLVRRDGTVPQPLEAVAVVAPLFVAFGLILLIGCANVTNLLLARSVARQREIGIRLSLGASRRRIIRQLLTESLLLALVAAAAGLAISRLTLEAIVYAVTTSFAADLGDIRLSVPVADWRVLLFLLVGAGVSTMVFALAPALQATRIEPIRTIRGEVVRDARPKRARQVLIGVQVAASALLLISAAVFLRSAWAAATFDPGMRASDTIAVQIPNEPMRDAIVREVAAEPSVTAVAASWPDAVALAPRPAFARAAGTNATVSYKFVSPEYFSVLDIAVVRGRVFTPGERGSSASVALVSESTARTLWPGAEAVGQVVHLEPSPAPESTHANGPPMVSRALTVVGVVRDVVGFRIAPMNVMAVYVPASAETPGTSLIARVQGDPDVARQALLNRLTAIDSDMARQVTTMRTLSRMETYFLQLAFWLTIFLGGLALALTLAGLFSVLSYLVEQRRREIGVRMALGATTYDVTRLVLSQSVRPVGFGLIAGGVSAAGLATLLIATLGAGSLGQIVRVLDPLAYVASLGVIVTACLLAASIPAARAARLDPTETLRQE